MSEADMVIILGHLQLIRCSPVSIYSIYRILWKITTESTELNILHK